MGVRSTIWADNRSSAGAVIGAAGPIGDLLFDPQTAGGLLAAVPQASAADLVTALQHAGYAQACVIGQLSGDAPQIRVLT
jgi:selenide,water dikinase